MNENNDYIELPEVLTPVITPASSTKKEKGKTRKFKLRSVPIEDLTELDIVNYIRNLPLDLPLAKPLHNTLNIGLQLEKVYKEEEKLTT